MAAVAAALVLLISGCNATKVSDLQSHGQLKPGSRPCGTFNLAINSWVGYEANAAVITYLAENVLGCMVKQKHIAEQVSWQGMSTGQVDAILENWGHDDLRKQYIDVMGAAQSAGSTGINGQIGWYVPPWMVEQYPDITDWHNLNKYAHLFKTSESGDKGQLLDGDPAYVTNDAALVANLGLNYKVVQGGSETALISSIRQAQRQRTPLLAYFYSPQWLLSEVPMVKIDLPPYTVGMRRRPGQDCLRLSGLRPGQDRRDQVRRIRQPGLHAGEELPVDRGGPELRRPFDRGGRDERRRGRQEVHRCTPAACRQMAGRHGSGERGVVAC